MGLTIRSNKGVAADIFPFTTTVIVLLFGTYQQLEVPITTAGKKKAMKVSDEWFEFEDSGEICWIDHEDDWQNVSLYKDRVAILVTREMWENDGTHKLDANVPLERVFKHTNKLIAQSWFRLKGAYLNTLKLDLIPNYEENVDSIVEVAYRTGGEHQVKLSPSLLSSVSHLVNKETANGAKRIKVTLTAKPCGVMDVQHHSYYDVDKSGS